MIEARKLSIELVPEPCWSNSLCNRLIQTTWDEIRRQTFRKAQQRCEICGTGGDLHCHEVWKYDDTHHVQTLIRVMAICKLCHRVKHLGHTQILVEQGIISLETVARHYVKINHVSRAQFEIDTEQAFATWKVRSRHGWATDFGKWTPLVETRSKRKYRKSALITPKPATTVPINPRPDDTEPAPDILW